MYKSAFMSVSNNPENLYPKQYKTYSFSSAIQTFKNILYKRDD